MAWFDEAVFYHIYPLGLLGAPKQNDYSSVTHRLQKLTPWIDHIKSIGCNAIYIGPLFESEGHGYETTDYKKLDSRLGDNKDLKRFVKQCHKAGIKVIFDGVFNHTGRNFFAFKDIKEKREGSSYRDWYCNVNFYGNNEYNDGFSYDNWSGYNLLVKLNQRNPQVRDYICDVIRFWVSEFDVDGIRLDAADVLDFDFMRALRATANEVKPDFWLMGEVIHGDYTRWANESTLHSVTNYNLHKALYSGHNDHNYFEIAHTVKRLYEMDGNRPDGLKLYNFADNHDVERIYTRLSNKAHLSPLYVLLYTLPGIPSIYYGSEFAIEGKKERSSDDSLRPALNLDDYKDALENNPVTALIARLGQIRQSTPALSYGEYRELVLTNRQYAFWRKNGDNICLVAVNNDDGEYTLSLPSEGHSTFTDLLSGNTYAADNGQIKLTLKGNSGSILVPGDVKKAPVPEIKKDMAGGAAAFKATGKSAEKAKKEPAKSVVSNSHKKRETVAADAPASKADQTPGVGTDSTTDSSDSTSFASTTCESSSSPSQVASFEDGIIRGLQEAVLARMEKNGPITDQMRRDVENNVYHDSLINWIKSF